MAALRLDPCTFSLKSSATVQSMASCLVWFVLFVLVSLLPLALSGSPWSPEITAQAKKILLQLTQEEKWNFVHGVVGTHVGNTNGVDRLNIPRLRLEDGPQGVADSVTEVTQFPSALTVIASFDENDYYLFGKTQAEEQITKGSNVLLGPMVNLARVPQGGRNFESTGEDPLLSAVYAKNFINGVQSQNIMGCVKHAFVNNQEDHRMSVSEEVSERAVHELYYPAFEAAVDAGVGSAMCAYNRINRTYACENQKTITFLKEEAGFQGFLMSDWYATHSTVESANSGLDQEMPWGVYFTKNELEKAVAAGAVNQSRIDDMVLRVLRAMIATNVMNYPPTGNILANATSADHNDIARRLSEDSTVLLKNAGGYLPLFADNFLSGGQSIAVIGDENTVHGTGSGGVSSAYLSTPYGGIAKLLMSQPSAPTRRVSCTFEENTDLHQLNDAKLTAQDVQECCRTCTAQADCNYFTFTSPNHCWLLRDNSAKHAASGVTSGSCAPLPLAVQYNSGNNVSEAVALASASSVTIVVVATSSGEGQDRPDLSLGNGQDELVNALANAVSALIVVVRSPGAVLMPWADHPAIRSIVWQGLPGQEGGNALASVLFGQKNPSGRLPLSFPKDLNDTWIQSSIQYPGVMGDEGFLVATYTEELLMGYRWYTTKNIRPLFSFGAGSSYSNFFYSSLSISGSVSSSSSATISFTITNRSARAGEDVAQLYVSFPDAAGEPKYVLRGFAKVSLSANQSKSVSFTVNAKDVKIWDTIKSAWQQVIGNFAVLISNSGPFETKLAGTFQSVSVSFALQ